MNSNGSSGPFGKRGSYPAQDNASGPCAQRNNHPGQDDAEEDSGFVLVSSIGNNATAEEAFRICQNALQAGIRTMPQRIPPLPPVPPQQATTLPC
jgi:hypothetical protein